MTEILLTNLARYRLAAGLSQRKLAKEAGLGYQTIRRLEANDDAGEIRLKTLSKIADTLGVTAADLLLEHNPTTPAATDPHPLNRADYQLLRHIQTGRMNPATLSKAQRNIHLPRLLQHGLITINSGQIRISAELEPWIKSRSE